MKNLLSSLTAFYHKSTQGVKGIYRKKGIRPGTDWKIIVCTFIFLILCAACVHVFIYLGVKNNSWWPVEKASNLYQVKIDKNLLQVALTRFNTQAEKFKALQATPSVQPDPSL